MWYRQSKSNSDNQVNQEHASGNILLFIYILLILFMLLLCYNNFKFIELNKYLTNLFLSRKKIILINPFT